MQQNPTTKKVLCLERERQGEDLLSGEMGQAKQYLTGNN